MTLLREISGQILVFKTNIRHSRDLKAVATLLDTDLRINRWNVALDDSDKVLRIQSSILQPHDVISTLTQAGFFCEELPD